METEPSFEVITASDAPTGDQLVFGVSHLGMAGVTAANYLVNHIESREIGHVDSTKFPTVAPFEAGKPRHPMRLYTSDASDLTVFVGESFIPVWAAEAFVDGFLEWVTASEFEEIVLLYGVPLPHGPQQHEVYYTATPEYREAHLEDGELEPLSGGFLDGVVAEIVLRALDGEAPPTGVFVTPSHPPGPDLEAAILLLDTVEAICEFTVDEKELRETAERMKQYYNELASRLEALNQGDQSLGSRDYPEDRMYM